MSCTEWRRLVMSYRAAVHAYDKAVAELADGSDVPLDQAWQRAETARRDADSARADLIQHEHEHACGAGSAANETATAAMSNYQLREGPLETAAVRLFNVNTECWETIEAAVHGQPPSGALAYQSSQTPHTAQWIIDPQDFKERRQHGAGLLYTEAGLKILRDDGLEM
jgi:hypothetical protein